MYRLLSLVVLLTSAPVFAETCSLGKMAELPVTMRGMQPTVPLKINGQPLTFLADSGAFTSIITPGTSRQLALKETDAPMGFYMTGVGGRAQATVTKVKDLTLAGYDLHDILFLVGGSEVNGLAGVVGVNVLGLADTEYDLAGGVIRLIRPHGCGKQSLAYWSGDRPVQVISIEAAGPISKHIYGTVLVNGVKLRAMFDTGASSSTITKTAAAKVGVKPGQPGVEEAEVARGLGRQVAASWIASFKSFRLGDEEISNTRIRISEVPNADFEMLVGADFFLSHHVYVSNAQHLLYATYNGGAVFRLEGKPLSSPSAAQASVDAVAAPTDADGFGRRGAARAARRDWEGAIADLDKAVGMAPKEPGYLVRRAEVRLMAHQPLRAKNDLDAALKLDANDVDALLTRARMYLLDRDYAAAHSDLVAAAKAAPPQADVRLAIAGMFDSARDIDAALTQYTLWLDVHRVDNKRATALNQRCWARARLAKDLPLALEDCNAALRERPGTASYLDSRGLVRLRQNDLARAITDYDAALKIQPKTGWSLYGRGLAKLRSGTAVEGRADIAAALAINPDLTEEARRYGIIPAEGEPR